MLGKINGKLVNCGGYGYGPLTYSGECYEYQKATDIWIPVSGLGAPKAGAGFVQLKTNNILIAGNLILQKKMGFLEM